MTYVRCYKCQKKTPVLQKQPLSVTICNKNCPCQLIWVVILSIFSTEFIRYLRIIQSHFVCMGDMLAGSICHLLQFAHFYLSLSCSREIRTSKLQLIVTNTLNLWQMTGEYLSVCQLLKIMLPQTKNIYIKKTLNRTLKE